MWTLLDHDAALLARVGAIGSATSVTCVQGDLETEGVEATTEAHVVTCSALLDILPKPVVHRLVRACAAASCGAYFALTYDGRIAWSSDDDADANDDDPDDAMIRETVNSHQRRNQGHRTALGPTAAAVADQLFRSEGYTTWRVQSPWHLTAADRELAHRLVDGWERASIELSRGPEVERRIRAWAERRRRATQASGMLLTVGHEDLLALPPAAGMA